jgi:excisionase family DNA binding protein
MDGKIHYHLLQNKKFNMLVDFQQMQATLEENTIKINRIMGKVAQLQPLDEWLTVKEAAKYAKFSERGFRRYIHEIKHSQRDAKILIRRSDVDRWLNEFSR